MNKVYERISSEKNVRCTMNTENMTVTHSKAPTLHYMGTACKQYRHDRFVKLKSSSFNRNASCKEDKLSLV